MHFIFPPFGALIGDYVVGILMPRKEVIFLGSPAGAPWFLAGFGGPTRFGFDWRFPALMAGLRASGLVALGLYRTRVLEHCPASTDRCHLDVLGRSG